MKAPYLILQGLVITIVGFAIFFIFFSHLNIKQYLVVKKIKKTEQEIKKLHYENIHLKVTLEQEFSKDKELKKLKKNSKKKYRKLYPKDIPAVTFE